jgi:DNA processing protein
MPNEPDVSRLYSAEELLGPLNPQERLYAPKQLFVAGHAEWLRQERRVSVVGARKASADGLKRAAKLARILVNTGPSS